MRPCILFAVLVSAFGSALPAAAQTENPQSTEHAQYADCTRQAVRDSENAYKRARAWYGRDKSMAAQHCMALALYELRQYGEAAETLDALLQRLSQQDKVDLWLNMKAQAAKAHLAAGNHAQAGKHLDDALLWAAEKQMDEAMVPLLLERARLHDEQNQHLKAVQDLDHALEIRPSTATRLERARIFLKMGMKGPAREDVETILKTEPKNQDALALLARTGK